MPVRTDEQLKKHQAALMELLTVFDNICRRLGISYQLFAGTALGAVRHKGFIPWDDDLDIIMLRPEYERFLKEAPAEPESEKYFLQAEFSEHWPMFFSKLRKNGTACIERYVPRDELMHQGIYIDIFPCDSLSDAPIIGKLQFAASKAVIARSLAKRGYRTDSKIKKLALKLSCLVPTKAFCRFVRAEAHAGTKRVHCFFGAASKYEKSVFPREPANSSVRNTDTAQPGIRPIKPHSTGWKILPLSSRLPMASLPTRSKAISITSMNTNR